jgi:hypothetical protein
MHRVAVQFPGVAPHARRHLTPTAGSLTPSYCPPIRLCGELKPQISLTARATAGCHDQGRLETTKPTLIIFVTILGVMAASLAVPTVRGRSRQWIAVAAIAGLSLAACLTARGVMTWPWAFPVFLVALVSILTACLGAAVARGLRALWIVACVITLLSIIAGCTVGPFGLQVYSYNCGPLCGQGLFLKPSGIAGAPLVGAAILSIRSRRVGRRVLLLLAGAAMCLLLVFFGFGMWIS